MLEIYASVIAVRQRDLATIEQPNDPAKRRNYKHSIDCVVRVAREEGASALWNGATPTILRAATLSGTLLAITSEAKVAVAERTGWAPTSTPTLFVSTLIASFFANCTCMPFDVVKSRIQQAPIHTSSYGPIHMLPT